jgi:hypothetical protein
MERTINYMLQGAAQNGYQGRKYLETSKEDVILHPIAVQFSTGTAVQFSTGIYSSSD